MLTKPCPKCPFRTDVQPFLRLGRVLEIHERLRAGAQFSCHNTVDYSDHDDDDECTTEHTIGPGEQFCAGALLLLEHQYNGLAGGAGCHINQAARFWSRFTGFNPDDLDHEAPVYTSFDAMIEAYEKENA